MTLGVQVETAAVVFGARARAARLERGLGARESAQAVGMTHGGLWKMEEGWSPPWLTTMLRLARLLHVQVSWLAGVGGDDVPPRCLPVLGDNDVRHAFGERMKFAREARGLLQREMGARMGRCESLVSNIERGARRTPRLDIIVRHCAVLEVPLDWALGDSADLSWLEDHPWA